MPLQASSSSSFAYGWEYHVFLSFRGTDTRRGFIGHLYKALCNKGIRTFIDDEDLQRGEQITPSLINAIQESRMAIPVFSKNYASSSFCLDELVKIMDCVKGKGRLVLPVFYEVDPSEVRHQIGSYKGALAKHEQRYKHDINKVHTWRAALRQAAALSGHHFNKLGSEKEYDFVDGIVKEISKRISRQPLYIADYPVGLEFRVIEVKQLLNQGSEDGVHTLGIYGIGGIGKSTLARAVYNSIADLFDHLCFLENLTQLFKIHDVPYVQKMLLSKIIGKDVGDLRSENELISVIKERLRCKRVLLVLDNVDKREHLKALIGSPDWLGSGSRVMITTRDKHLLTEYGVEKIYEVGVLNEKEASELFAWNTFKSNQVKPCYMHIFNELVQYASGHPLALEVIGSNLFDKSVEEWTCALDLYKKIPDKNVQEILKGSFDTLQPQQKDIFLDIACCFNGYHLALVEDILHAHYNIGPTYCIGMLVDKSLISIDKYNVIKLHDLIQDMGREIVRLESEKNPGERSRLWLAEDIIKVLQEDQGSRKIQIIHLEFGYNDDIIEWKGHAFKKMKELKTLIIKRGQFSRGPTYLPKNLKVLIWQKYPSRQDLPCYFHPEELVILQLSTNYFDSVQLAKLLKKEFMNMKVLTFDECEGITKIPDVSSAPKLEKLSFVDCKNLTEIDRSVGLLPKLKILNAEGCSQLRSFPPLLLPSLEQLKLSGCSTLERFPEILGEMGSIDSLVVRNISNIKFPHSVHYLTGLWSLTLRSCGTVVLPSSVNLLPELKDLDFQRCKSVILSNEDEGEQQVISAMPPSMPISLSVYFCDMSEQLLQTALSIFTHIERLHFIQAFRILPECINEFHFLKTLDLYNFDELEEIQEIPPNIEELDLRECRSLSRMTRKMLLNKKLHEERQFERFVLPGKRLPKWFEHRRRGSPFTFWIRNKLLPSLCLGVCNLQKIYQLVLHLTSSNGENKYETLWYSARSGHIGIFSKLKTSLSDEGVAPSENEWTRVVIFAYKKIYPKKEEDLDIEIGVHIMRERGGRMDDIQFSDPTKEDTLIEKQVQLADPLSVPLSLLFDHSDSNSHQIITTTPTLHLPGVWCHYLCDMLSSLVSLCSSSSFVDSP